MNTITVGIVGAGRIGKIHAENLLQLPYVRVKAVSDLFGGPDLNAWCRTRNINQVYKDSSELIADPDIEAVFICSSTDTHVPLIQQAARAGKHIFCEKPVSMSINETEQALEVVHQAGVKLQIGFNRRFDHNFKRVREHVSQGAIGEPHLVKITSRDPSPPPTDYIKVSGGLFMDMMIHDFDMARFLCGSEVVEVFAQGSVLIDSVFQDYNDIDTAVVTLKFANGALGLIDNSRQAVYGYDQRVEVFGSKGSAVAGNDFPNTAELLTETGAWRDNPLHFFLERYEAAYREEAQLFIHSLLHNHSVAVNGNDGLQAERIALAAQLSYRLGRPVKLDELSGLDWQQIKTG